MPGVALRVFGYELGFGVTRTKGSPPMSSVSDNRGGWMRWIREPYAGAWQRNDEWTTDSVLANHAVYACVTLIAADVGKLRPMLMHYDANGIWTETQSPAFSPVLRKPNRFQNHIQFKEWWITSKLITGNAYVLLERDARGIVVRQYLLDPQRVTPMVAPDGSVFYRLGQDNLSSITDTDTLVPASEIIHDRMNCLFHPLVGTSPIFACGMAATLGLNIERNTTHFFGSGSNPSGLLTTAANISQEEATAAAARWKSAYGGDRSGEIAVLGQGVSFTPLRMNAVDSQLIEQLGWTATAVCSAFHVPPFKIGIGQMPTYQNGETLNGIYYSDCLQSHIEQWELCQDEGLGIGHGSPKDGKTLGVGLDLDGLFRMDSATQIRTLADGVKGAIYAPNEARRKLDLPPMPGGDSPMAQQQNYSLAALDRRDSAAPAPSDEPAVSVASPAGEPADKAFGDMDDLILLLESETAAMQLATVE